MMNVILRRAVLLGIRNGDATIPLYGQPPKRALKTSPTLRDVGCGGSARVRYVKAPTGCLPQEAYRIKNVRMGRPLSPSIGIYKRQLTSVLSITNRISGILLSMQLAALGLACLWMCRSEHGFDDFMRNIEKWELSKTEIFLMKIFLIFPLAYHTCLGIRHLLWDSGRCLTLPWVYKTGYVAVLAAFLLTAILGGLGSDEEPPSDEE